MFQFDFTKVEELEIRKSDPGTADRWGARFRKEQGDWKIARFPDSRKHTDQRANTKFIDHLLDTLGTLTVESKAKRALPATFGFAPPRFVIRWRVGPRWHQLELGDALKNNREAYARFPGLAPRTMEVYVVRGAAIRMLELLRSFSTVRQQRLFSASADEVYRFHVRAHGKTLAQAKRTAGQWPGTKGRAQQIDRWLQGLLHLQAQDFVDVGRPAAELYRRTRRTAQYEIEIQKRLGDPVRAFLRADPDRLLAVTNQRPGAAFVLPLEAVRLFNWEGQGK